MQWNYSYNYPLTQGFIGVEKFIRLAQKALETSASNKYPPYDIHRNGNVYTVDLAVAGFRKDEIDITVNDNVLIIAGNKEETDSEDTLLYRGIAARNFVRRFALADTVEVTEAKLEDGILRITCEDKTPEKKAKIIDIK